MSAAVAAAPLLASGSGSFQPIDQAFSTVPVLIRSFEPLPRCLSFRLPASTTADQILQGFALGLCCFHNAATTVRLDDFSLCYRGRILAGSVSLQSLSIGDAFPITLEVRPLVRGGKGGFGSQLRAAGGKMSAGAKNANNDSCRDLEGRRLGVMKEAKKLAAYLEGEQERKRQLDEAQKKKYAKLERMLGRKPRDVKDFEEAANLMVEAGQGFDDGSASPEPGPSGSRTSRAGSHQAPGLATAAGSKRKERLEDSEYVEQSREIVENVRSAVATAMLKKKKKLAAAKSKTSPAAVAVEAKQATA
ncbi:hypothetical protein ACQY0O_005929 [Thecaphora frezii]